LLGESKTSATAAQVKSKRPHSDAIEFGSDAAHVAASVGATQPMHHQRCSISRLPSGWLIVVQRELITIG
jgi:hypothetical protein